MPFFKARLMALMRPSGPSRFDKYSSAPRDKCGGVALNNDGDPPIAPANLGYYFQSVECRRVVAHHGTT